MTGKRDKELGTNPKEMVLTKKRSIHLPNEGVKGVEE